MIVPGVLSGAIYTYFENRRRIYKTILREMRMQLSPLSIKGVSGIRPMRLKISREDWKSLCYEVKKIIRKSNSPEEVILGLDGLKHELFPKY